MPPRKQPSKPRSYSADDMDRQQVMRVTRGILICWGLVPEGPASAADAYDMLVGDAADVPAAAQSWHEAMGEAVGDVFRQMANNGATAKDAHGNPTYKLVNDRIYHSIAGTYRAVDGDSLTVRDRWFGEDEVTTAAGSTRSESDRASDRNGDGKKETYGGGSSGGGGAGSTYTGSGPGLDLADVGDLVGGIGSAIKDVLVMTGVID